MRGGHAHLRLRGTVHTFETDSVHNIKCIVKRKLGSNSSSSMCTRTKAIAVTLLAFAHLGIHDLYTCNILLFLLVTKCGGAHQLQHNPSFATGTDSTIEVGLLQEGNNATLASASRLRVGEVTSNAVPPLVLPHHRMLRILVFLIQIFLS